MEITITPSCGRAIVPQVQKLEDEPSGARQWRKAGNGGGPARQVHAVEDEPQDDDDGGGDDHSFEDL